MVKGIRDGCGVGGGFIMMGSIHYEVADGAARNARSGAPLCAAMHGEWICGGIGIEVRTDHSASLGCPAPD